MEAMDAPSSDTRAGRALIAEDNEANYELLNELLATCGWTVAWARDGYETLEQLEREPFDLLLLDLHMPNLDGVEALKQMKTDGRWPRPRIVVVTADVFYGLRTDLSEWGVDAMLSKPVDLLALSEILAGTPRRAAVTAL